MIKEVEMTSDERVIKFYQDFVDKLISEVNYTDRDMIKDLMYHLSLYVYDKMIDSNDFEAWEYTYREINRIRELI